MGHQELNQLLVGAEAAAGAMPLWLVTEAELPAVLAGLPPSQRRWIDSQGFRAERGRTLPLPAADGALGGALMGMGGLASAEELTPWDAAGLPERLPAANYRLVTPLSARAQTQFAIGWLHGCYRLTHYRTDSKQPSLARLVAPDLVDVEFVHAQHAAATLARDLINAPANELGPAELAETVRVLAGQTAGSLRICMGNELRQQYPLVHAVGQGSAREPRLIDCRWPRAGAPRVTLVGKGVCFDSGGLDLKPSAAMLLMKKDMGGAACALALAQLLLALRAPIELRLLIPAVENSVSGSAFRPGDVWSSRKGLTVEIGNTDAEGRLVLADALADADSEQPDLLIDLATLTGAARAALGPELPAVFSNDATLLEELRRAGEGVADPLWPLPLWSGYDDELGSRIADLNNVSGNAFAGAIIGALFLRRFVTATPGWVHIDMYAWNARERPGRPIGAEAQCVRALYALIRQRFG
jgi:leucyl aminopeptidase